MSSLTLVMHQLISNVKFRSKNPYSYKVIQICPDIEVFSLM